MVKCTRMCYGATCPTCCTEFPCYRFTRYPHSVTDQNAAKKSWRGCGSHIPAALAGIPEEQWCTCTPRVTVDGKAYPPAAKVQIPGLSWLTGMFGGGSSKGEGGNGKGEL
ncbi:hypothetical protein F4780DRAFT_487345 [Xylariomycetidae sp. FL0641]|nr:hypothetical protein F4780DRAFT_487345 [Xylariomycetidae sp. FL0641]